MSKELTDEQITAASMPLILRKGNSKLELQMSPLCDLDYSELNNWLRSYTMELIYSTLPPPTSPESMQLRQEVIGIATKQVGSISWHSLDGIRILETSEGMARIVWMCCRQHNGQIGPQELATYFNNVDNAREYNRVFLALHPHFNPSDDTSNGQSLQADEIDISGILDTKKKSKSHQKKTRKQRSTDS